jgi:thiamine monophosphate kinase
MKTSRLKLSASVKAICQPFDCQHSVDIKSVTDALKEYRKNQGKATEWFHYKNEAQLICFAFTGDCKSNFAFATAKREYPTLFREILYFNRRMIKRGIQFKDRKLRCRAMVLKRQAADTQFK